MTTVERGAPEPAAEARRFDVFLSYASEDWDKVEPIARALVHAGLTPWVDKWNLPGGSKWVDEMPPAVAASRSIAVFAGPGDLGIWEREEIRIGWLQSVSSDDFRLFAVLLPGIKPLEPDALPPQLRLRTWVDLRELDERNAVDHIVHAVNGVPLTPHAPAGAGGSCPYRGLDVFEEHHADVFFGREHDVQKLLEHLRRRRSVALVGESGSGKSSLLRAGVIHALRRGDLPGSRGWRTCVVRAGPDPLETLAAAVCTLREDDQVAATLDALAADDRALHLAIGSMLADAGPDERAVIVVDQLEEAFAHDRDDGRRARAFDNLAYAASHPDGRTIVVLALRADFIPRAAEHEGLQALIDAGEEVIGPLNAHGLRLAIEGPARAAGLQLEPGLRDTILADAGSTASTLPLLQYALTQTWERRQGALLTLAGYRRSGGVAGALAARGEAVHRALDDAGRLALRRILLRLARPGGAGVEDSRRRAPRSELDSAAGDAGVVSTVIAELVTARLVTTGGDGRHAWVEVTHEALIRGWPRLHDWIGEKREGLLLQRRLTDAAEVWRDTGHDPHELYGEVRLRQIHDLLERDDVILTPLERAFVGAGDAEASREHRAAVRRITIAGIALVAALVAIGSFALIAVHRRHVAESGELAARSTTLLDVDPGLSLDLALAAYDTSPTAAAAAALRQATLGFNQRGVFGADRSTAWAAAISPDGTRAVSVGDQGIAKLWNTSGGRPLATLRHKGALDAARWSPDGSRIAFGGNGRQIVLADPFLGNATPVDVGNHDALSSLAFSADSTRLAAGFGDGTVVVLAGRSPIARFVAGADYVAGVALDADGTHVAAAGHDGAVTVWNVADQSAENLRPASAVPQWAVAFRPGTSQLLAAGDDGRVRIWDTATGARKRTFIASNRRLFAATYTRDGTRFATAGEDGVARVWSALGGSPLTVLRGQGGAVRDVGFDAAGDRAVTAGDDGTMRTWAVARTVVERSPATNEVSFSEDGRLLVGGGAGGVRVWNVASGRKVGRLPSAGQVYAAFGGRGDRIVVATVARVLVWTPEAKAAAPVATATAPVQMRVAELDRTARRVVYADTAGHLVVHDLAGMPDVTLRRTGETMITGLFSPDGTRVAAGGDDGVIRVWRISRPAAPESTLQGQRGGLNSLAFSPDSRRLVSAGIDGSVHTFDLAGHTSATLLGNHEDATSAEFTPGGGRVVTASQDGTARLWNADGGAPLVTLETRDQALNSAVFSPGGTAFASVGADGTVRVGHCAVCGPVRQVLALARSLPRPRFTDADRRRYLSTAG
jgi:WD40 repeat protein